MKFVVLFAAFTIAIDSSNSSHVDWGYSGSIGPEFWGDIKPEYALCKYGLQQSPIDIIASGSPAKLKTDIIKVDWPTLPSANFEKEPGISVDLSIPENASNILIFDWKLYKLAKIHFHIKSEHVFEGMSYPMEFHMVHEAADGSLTVVGIIVNLSNTTSPFLKQFLELGDLTNVRFDSLLYEVKNLKSVFTYIGSLTVPPCTEGVNWMVSQVGITITESDLNVFKSFLPPTSARPVQVHKRREYVSGSPSLKPLALIASLFAISMQFL